jgi:replicative DNA helicase
VASPIRFGYPKTFQTRILRVLYSEPDFAGTVALHLQPEFFDHRYHRWVASKLLTYLRKHGHGVARDALCIELLRDGKLGRISSADAIAANEVIQSLHKPIKDRSYVKEELHKFIKQQATRRAILNSLDHLEAQDYPAIDVEFQKVIDVQDALEGGLGQFYVRDVKERTKRRKVYTPNGISTGLRLDDFLKPGGLPPKALGVVMAPTGIGKTFTLVHLGKSAVVESQAKVLHVTLELSEDMVIDRYDAAFSGVSIARLEDKAELIEDAVIELGKQYGDFLVVKEFPPATLTVPALRSYIRHLERAAFYPGIVLVDYADEMAPSMVRRRDSSTYEEMGNIYSELRKLSYTLNAPVWTASQTQRSALNKEFVDLDSVGDSWRKPQVADLFIVLCQTLREKRERRARLFVAKNRFGPDKMDLSITLDKRRSIIRDA